MKFKVVDREGRALDFCETAEEAYQLKYDIVAEAGHRATSYRVLPVSEDDVSDMFWVDFERQARAYRNNNGTF